MTESNHLSVNRVIIKGFAKADAIAPIAPLEDRDNNFFVVSKDREDISSLISFIRGTFS